MNLLHLYYTCSFIFYHINATLLYLYTSVSQVEAWFRENIPNIDKNIEEVLAEAVIEGRQVGKNLVSEVEEKIAEVKENWKEEIGNVKVLEDVITIKLVSNNKR